MSVNDDDAEAIFEAHMARIRQEQADRAEEMRNLRAQRDEALAMMERYRTVAVAARAWRHAQCDQPSDCGDGWSYHSHDCPTSDFTRGLVEAIESITDLLTDEELAK